VDHLPIFLESVGHGRRMLNFYNQLVSEENEESEGAAATASNLGNSINNSNINMISSSIM
jgi:hypothetical protein